MKKFLFSIATIACVAFIFSSCEKEIVDNTTPVSSDTVTITFNASSSLLGSKTYIDGNNVKWADSGEIIRAFEVATPNAGNPVTASRYSSEGETTDSGATMTFGTSWPALSTEDYSSFDYYAFYPNSAYQAPAKDPNVSSVLINTPALQTPTADSFDPAADLLIAKAKTGLTSQPSELSLQFARAVAVAKMTIKNLETTDPITKITFSAKNGDTPVKLAGRTAYNLASASLVSSYASNVAETSIVINCSGITQTANTSAGTPVFFTCYPFALNSTTPGSFKVVVETATESFTKEVTVNSSKGLVLTAAQPSIFAVDMDNITGTPKAADLCYAYLDYADYAAAGGTTSYSNVTVNKTHGDSWVTYAIATSGSIGIRRNDKEDNDSYIKLPDFTDDIETVVVTLGSVTAGKTLSLETSATENTGTIDSKTTTESLVYTFDLSSDSYKTAYLRASGAQAVVSKIEVYAGSDTRTQLAAPTNVGATLNTDDANVTNSIDVSWDAVDGAGSYIITLMDENTDLVIKEASSSPYTVTGLEYDMEYLIAVKAVPSDVYVNTESSETDAPSPVSTGSEVITGAYYEKITTVASVTDGEYIIAAYANSKYYALSNTFATQISGAEITVSNNKISESDGEDYVVTIAVNGSGNISISNGTKYLSCAASGTNFTIGDSEVFHTIALASNGTFQIKHLTAARAIIYRTSTYNRFGNYSTSGVNGTEYYNIELFKKVDTRSDAGLAWNETAPTASIGDGDVITFTPPTLTNTHGVDVTYSSSDEDVATIDNTGAVTILAEGETTISAIFAGDATYKPATVSYTLTVTDARTAYTTPTFSPAAGEVSSGAEVTISCAGADAIYYTINGTTPDQNSTLYDGPISVTSTVTIKAIAYKAGRKPSAVASATYTVAGSLSTTLTNANIVAAGDASDSYASYSLTDDHSNTYSAYAIKKSHSKATSAYHFLQIKKYASSTAYYIQVPELGTKITSITMTVSGSNQAMDAGGNTATLYFSASNSTSATGAGVASGTGASSVTIDCSALNLNTGYITAGGAVRIWDIEITYTN